MTSTNSIASTNPRFFYCGKCGYKNHPRHYGDPDRCEQCGAEIGDKSHVPYRPEGA